MSNLKKKMMFICLIFIGLVSINSQVNASQLKFSVEPVIPENQKDQSKTYFDLNVKPEGSQVLKIHMRNDTDKEVTVEPSVHAATTNINGVVEYGESNTKLNKTSQYNIENIVKPAVKEVKIPANGATDLELTVDVPKGQFEGILAGGITLKEKDTHEEKQKQEGQGLAIENKYAYVVAVVLNESEAKVDSELTLEKVKPNQVNARNVISATLKNTKPKYMNQLSIDTKVTKKDDKETLYSSKKEGMQMAPNTSFDYPVPLNGEKLKAGKYTLYMTAKSMGDTWKFKKDFTIEAEVAKAFNEKDVTVKKDYTWLYISIGILLILIAFFLIWLIVRKKKKEEQEREEQRRREQRRRKAKKKKNAQKLKQQNNNT